MDFNINEFEELKILTCTTDTGTLYQLSSRYHNSLYQELWAQNHIRQALGSHYFVFGFGDGSFLRTLLKKIDSDATVIVYEPCKDLFDYVQSNYSIDDILDDNRINLLFHESNSNLIQKLNGYISIVAVEGTSTCVHPNYANIFPSEYAFFQECLSTATQLTISAAATSVKQGGIIIENILENYKIMPSAYSAEALREIIPPDLPILIVGAGPSLNQAMDYIKGNRDKAVILAVDTAVPSLLKHDIIPHFFISADPIKEEFLFSDPRVASIPAIVPVVCRKKITANRMAPTFFYSASVRFCDLLTEYYDIKLPAFDAETSVANHAFAVTIHLNSKNVLLIGVDLAFLNGQTHSVGSGKEDIINNDTSTQVEGVNGEILYSEPQMSMYRLMLEERIATHPSIHVINTSQTGAKIAGTEQLTIEKAYEKYCPKDISLNGYETISSLNFDKKIMLQDLISKQENFVTSLEKTIARAKTCPANINYNDALPIIYALDRLVSFILGTAYMELTNIKTIGTTYDQFIKLREKTTASEHIGKYVSYLSEAAKNCKYIIDREKELLE